MHAQPDMHCCCETDLTFKGLLVQVRLSPPLASYMDLLASLAPVKAGIEACLCGHPFQAIADLFLQDLVGAQSAFPKLPVAGERPPPPLPSPLPCRTSHPAPESSCRSSRPFQHASCLLLENPWLHLQTPFLS